MRVAREHRRLSLLIASLMLAATLLSAGVAIASTPASAAISTVGGPISRSEVIDRAHYWLQTKPPYSQTDYAADPEGRSYRQDCSGSVSMAWHLDQSYTTYQLNPGNAKYIGLTVAIPYDDLQPGDALVKDADGTDHIALFDHWSDTSHASFVVDEEYDYGFVDMQATWDRSYASTYTPIRYDNIVSSAPSVVTGGGSFVRVGSEWHGVRVGGNGHVYQTVVGSSGTVTQDLGGSARGVAAIVYHGGRFDVFALAPSGNLYQDIYQDGWSGWRQADGVTFATGSGISAIYAEGAYRVFGIGPAGTLYQAFYSDSWQSQNLGGSLGLSGTPGVTYVDGRYDVFALAPSGDLYQDIYQDGWSGWRQAVGVKFAAGSGVSAIYGQGDYRVYGVGPSGSLYQVYYDGGWNSQDLGGSFDKASTPSATFADDRYDLFGTSPSGSLYQRTYTTSWTPWTNIAQPV